VRDRARNRWKAFGAIPVIPAEQRDVGSFFVWKNPDTVVFLFVNPPGSEMAHPQAWRTSAAHEMESCLSLQLRCQCSCFAPDISRADHFERAKKDGAITWSPMALRGSDPSDYRRPYHACFYFSC